jgi:hypothetical protein
MDETPLRRPVSIGYQAVVLVEEITCIENMTEHRASAATPPDRVVAVSNEWSESDLAMVPHLRHRPLVSREFAADTTPTSEENLTP